MTTYKKRLQKIIELSAELLRMKIENKFIEISNEATLQHQFGVILNAIGKQFEFSRDEYFSVEFEHTFDNANLNTWKSKQKARADLYLSFPDGKKTESAVIELKFFLYDKEEETVTDNRFAFYGDLENLEAYPRFDNNIVLEYALLYTNNLNYTISKSNVKDYPIAEGYKYAPSEDGRITRVREKKQETIVLHNSYTFSWNVNEDTSDAMLLMPVSIPEIANHMKLKTAARNADSDKLI